MHATLSHKSVQLATIKVTALLLKQLKLSYIIWHINFFLALSHVTIANLKLHAYTILLTYVIVTAN